MDDSEKIGEHFCRNLQRQFARCGLIYRSGNGEGIATVRLKVTDHLPLGDGRWDAHQVEFSDTRRLASCDLEWPYFVY
jgi:hypothetical protein